MGQLMSEIERSRLDNGFAPKKGKELADGVGQPSRRRVEGSALRSEIERSRLDNGFAPRNGVTPADGDSQGESKVRGKRENNGPGEPGVIPAFLLGASFKAAEVAAGVVIDGVRKLTHKKVGSTQMERAIDSLTKQGASGQLTEGAAQEAAQRAFEMLERRDVSKSGVRAQLDRPATDEEVNLAATLAGIPYREQLVIAQRYEDERKEQVASQMGRMHGAGFSKAYLNIASRFSFSLSGKTPIWAGIQMGEPPILGPTRWSIDGKTMQFTIQNPRAGGGRSDKVSLALGSFAGKKPQLLLAIDYAPWATSLRRRTPLSPTGSVGNVMVVSTAQMHELGTASPAVIAAIKRGDVKPETYITVNHPDKWVAGFMEVVRLVSGGGEIFEEAGKERVIPPISARKVIALANAGRSEKMGESQRMAPERVRAASLATVVRQYDAAVAEAKELVLRQSVLSDAERSRAVELVTIVKALRKQMRDLSPPTN